MKRQPDVEDLHTSYGLRDVARPERELTDILEVHFVELPTFGKDKPHELRTPFERWLHLMKFGCWPEAWIRKACLN